MDMDLVKMLMVFACGLSIGAIFGFLILAIFVVGKRADRGVDDGSSN